MKAHTIFITIVITLAVGIGVWREARVTHETARTDTELKLLSGTLLPGGKVLPTFQLTDQNNDSFDNASLKHNWSFMFFGYTNCPDICPTTLSALAHISQRIGPNPYVQYLFVSITPEQDTAEQLTKFFSKNEFKLTRFRGLTGDIQQIQNLAQDLGIYIEEQTDVLAGAHIGHSGAILLVNPQGELSAVFTSVEKPHRIAHDFKEIMAHNRLG
jgi:protein SCO1/2